VLIALAGEDIKSVIIGDAIALVDTVDSSEYHYDRPVPLVETGSIIMDLNQCTISNNPDYPKLKLDLVIPLLDFQISDSRLVELIGLVFTLPLPIRSTEPKPSAFIDVS